MAKHILNLGIDNRLKSNDETLVNDIANLSINGKKKCFYSFATKYCSHHNPINFPIYDSYVDKILNYYKRKDHFYDFKREDLTMKKKILIVFLIIIVIALVGVGYFVFTDMMQEDKLKTELSELNDLVNAENIDMDVINERLDRRITTGDYEKVEDAYKSYLRDNFDNSIQIANILNDEKITTLLTVENYQQDGKDFTNSKEYITNTRETLEDCKNKYTEFFSEDKAMSYINSKGLDSYYTDLYRNELMGDMDLASQDTTVQDSIDEVISILNTSEEVLNLLSENQDAWEIEGENIVFNSDSLSNQYDSLINSL